MIDPKIINVICPKCKLSWMSPPLGANRIDYFCYQCGFTMDEDEAKKVAWRSGSIYYGE